jgi:hypothetical protein
MLDTSRGRPPVAASRYHTRSDNHAAPQASLDKLRLIGDHITHLLGPTNQTCPAAAGRSTARLWRPLRPRRNRRQSGEDSAPAALLCAIDRAAIEPVDDCIVDEFWLSSATSGESCEPWRSRQSAAQFGPSHSRAAQIQRLQRVEHLLRDEFGVFVWKQLQSFVSMRS